jgi:very-short-patch-repair endonuclease
MYEDLCSPFSVRWAREAGFGVKSLMRLQRAGLMTSANRKLRLVDATPERVATTAVGPLVGVAQRSAAAWYGWSLLNPAMDVELAVPRRRCPTPWPGTRIVRTQLDASQLTRVRNVPITTPMRTALDLAQALPLADAVAVLDAACRQGGITISGLRFELRRIGRPKTTLIASLVNPQRASVYESLFFVLMMQARLTPPRCQFEIRRGSVLLARADFALPNRRVVVEIDGFEFHSDKARFIADRRRQNLMVNEGWRVLRFTPADLVLRREEVIAEVRTALRLPLPKINAATIMETAV